MESIVLCLLLDIWTAAYLTSDANPMGLTEIKMSLSVAVWEKKKLFQLLFFKETTVHCHLKILYLVDTFIGS